MAIPGLSVDDDALGHLLRGKRHITVPMYQRHYKWEKEQVEDLLDDLENELVKGPKDPGALFLGTIVFETDGEQGSRTTHLLDGQQRLFTLGLVQIWWM